MTVAKKEPGIRQRIVELKERRPHGQHPGLILLRYLTCAATGKDSDTKERRALLDAAIGAAKSNALHAIYSQAFDRWNASFSNDGQQDVTELRTQGRLIVGLGTENVLETGIRLHHTYGVPFIPGSALKGLAAHYCQEIWGCRHLNDVDEERRRFRRPTPAADEQYRKLLRGDAEAQPNTSYFRLLFGNTDDSGAIVFHDAWLTPDSLKHNDGALHLDVMTPHHPDFQRGPDDAKFKPPTDFDSPIPIAFLSVSGTFRIRLSWCGPSGTATIEAQAWMQLAITLLQEALAEWGVGGKTSSGYGRLVAAKTVVQTTSQPLYNPMKGNLAGPPPAPPALPKADDRVQAELLSEKTKKGGWRARHSTTRIEGPIQNTADVPPDAKAGQQITLIVKSANPKEIAFHYPTAADEQRQNAPRGQGKPKRDGPKGGGQRRR
jgi:CRISPR-associated protein Cmr6